ncbi:MAG: cob(I)yrinic acid a,c-diamide adenosyltransferase [Bacteroidales bacterium]|nr:cob(I)yrinic acid a,c-diamide adenosyltransferase [Bacteroidales bacterium]MDD4670539.1 cob(I)yrinic acid a,c-diamide adenosyltransferase [Bacteroidales bacterium]
MKLYTKTGDNGTTSLVGGTRVSKSHPRVMAYGDVDELISYLGILRSETDDTIPLRRIQAHLMTIAAYLAADRKVAKLKPYNEDETMFLESEIDKMTALLPEQKAFVLPAQPRVASECHVARTICRRAERSAIGIEDKSAEDQLSIRYINRLSDYLFTLARYLCMVHKVEDDYWIP